MTPFYLALLKAPHCSSIILLVLPIGETVTSGTNGGVPDIFSIGVLGLPSIGSAGLFIENSTSRMTSIP